MRNFGEELAYWYLRLNGFFLIDDFVLHNADLVSSQNADADVIGIRNPFTIERIGMNDDDDICPELSGFEPNIKTKTVVVISEVKTSPRRQNILLEREDRLSYIVKRTGLFPPESIDDVISQLFENNSYSNGEITILKIIFSQTSYNNDRFHWLTLDHINNQITQKFLKYIGNKRSTKHLFPSTLMQYLIWKAEQANGLENQEEVREQVAYTNEKTN